MNRDQVLGLLRHLLTVAGTYAVAKGWIGAGVAEQVVGALVVLASAGWSTVEKR
jgi:hypothetical protein